MAKCIQFFSNGRPEVMRYINFIPNNPKDNEVQVENKAIGVNYIDIYTRSGLYPISSFPSRLGIEAAGIITKIGRNVKHFKIGDRVVYAQSTLGAYADYHNVFVDKIVLLPKTISFSNAAALFLKGLTVFYLFHQVHQLKPGEIFLFYASSGGVGRIACQWSKSIRAKMIGVVSSEKKACISKNDGAWKVINYKKEDILEKVLEFTEEKKVNVVYDSVGKDTFYSSLNSLSQKGLMVSFGNTSGKIENFDLNILKEKGSLYITRPYLNDYIDKCTLQIASKTLFSMIENNLIHIDIQENQKFHLSEAKFAHELLESRKTIGPLILITEKSCCL